MIPYRVILTLLALLFAARVVAQFTLQFISPAGLPAFEQWHSEALPYEALLASQLVILALMGWAIASAPLTRPRPWAGRILMVLGWMYVAVMATRLIIGVGGYSDHPWFDGAISTAFHFVLAAFVLVLGSAWKGAWRDGEPARAWWPRYVGYPALIAGGYALFAWLLATGAPLLFTSYLAAGIASFGVLLHETFAPARRDWRPSVQDVVRDSAFLALVQVGLPAALKIGALALIVWVAQSDLAPLSALWPQDWPILAQVALMAVIAEFFRYWIHRALHTYGPLWRLHAVHHAPDKLYTINVGRFHPLDKTLQFFGDTLPFLALGVSAEVFAAYFTLYAINGFYQHSNADVRLGPLNWIIAGPELHRWHHSTKLEEAMSNYGNNLIIWDAVFGTRYLPKDRALDTAGIENTRWPQGFFPNLIAPFTTAPNPPPEPGRGDRAL